jgi:zinc protease
MSVLKNPRSLLLILVLASNCLFAQKYDLKQTVPLDPAVKTGKLSNGLTYYLRQNPKPEKRLELRLAINAGSICESDLQQGLAHFCEHMCFNGTQNFKKNELVDALESIGVKFGADLNAYTSFDETVYMLQIPSDKKELIEKGFLILSDWANKVSLEDVEIDKERGVILEELRLGLGASDRMRKKYFPVLLQGSLYADRMPIGKPDILKSFKYETLRSFYKQWYRPDLMGVAVVGDIPTADAEMYVKKYFGTIKPVKNPKPRIEHPIPDNAEPLISIVTDKEATSYDFQIMIKHPKAPNKTIGDYRESLLASLYNGMISIRLRELSLKSDASFVSAGSNFSGFLGRTRDAYSMSASCKENQINKAMEVVLTENERVKQFGFTQAELDRRKKQMLSSYETMAKNADKTESRSFVNEYVSYYLKGEPSPGIKTEFEYAKAFLPEVTLEEINKLAKTWLIDKNMAIVVMAPEKEGLKIPTEGEIKEIIKSVKTKKLEAYQDKTNDAPLLAQKPAGSKVVNKTENGVFGYTELTFANGVKAILKPTTFKNDEIQVKAFSPGGSSLYADSEILSAILATSIVGRSGLGAFDMMNLQKKLTGINVNISPYITGLTEGFSGSSTPKDLETLLQLNYLYFVNVRLDSSAFNTYLAQTRDRLKSIRSNPKFLYSDTCSKITFRNNPRVINAPSEKQLNELKLARIMDIFKDRFADASDFTYVFVGNFNVDEITPLLETYLGGLPSTNRKETWKDVSPEYAPGVIDFKYPKNSEQQSSVQMVFHGQFDWNVKDRQVFRILSQAVSIKLRESMREDQGGVYGVSFSESISKFPKPKFTVTAQWGCAPDNVDKLSQTVFDVLAKIKQEGPTDIDMQKVTETMIRDRETKVKENGYWLSAIESAYYNGDKMLTSDEYVAMIKSISKEDVKNLAIKYLDGKEYIKTAFMPEVKK